MRRLLVSVSIVSCCVLAGCNKQDAKTAWNDVIKKCAVSDLNGPNILYFGPSNVIGIGSIWRQGNDNTLHLRYDSSDLPTVPAQNFVVSGNNSPCEGANSTTFSFKAAGDLTASPLAVSADVANDLEKATNVSAKATSMRWDTLKEAVYENYVKGLPHNSPIYTELKEGHRLVMTRALKISGFAVTLTFKSGDVAALKAAYNGPLSKDVTGNVSGSLNASWSTDGKLTLTADNDFYIAGELGAFSPTGFQRAHGAVRSQTIKIPSGVKLGRDKT